MMRGASLVFHPRQGYTHLFFSRWLAGWLLMTFEFAAVETLKGTAKVNQPKRKKNKL
jgi:hypothetical protein